MYAQITTRCNMKCPHCMFACTNKGEDMTMETWKAALVLARENEWVVTIGGGEPTLHPQFWEFMGVAMSYYTPYYPEHPFFIVTNGSVTSSAIALAGMAKRGIIGAALSRDQWHDAIDHKVVEAFTRSRLYDRETDHREIRTVQGIVKRGRARTWGTIKCDAGCGPHVDPSGAAWSCACRKLSLGTVHDFVLPEVDGETLDMYESECGAVTVARMRKQALKLNTNQLELSV